MPLARAAACVLAVAIVAPGAADGQHDKPLPVPDALYRAVRENLLKAEGVAHLYSFKERRTEVHTNPFGKIGTGGTQLVAVYPSPVRQLTYRRLLERNGVAVPAADLAEQDRRYRGRVAEVQQEIATRTPADQHRQRANDTSRRERRQRRVEDVVEVLQFTVEGRTVYNGVPAIVITFTPRPGAKPVTREGRTAVNFQGKVWIDEAVSEVMRVEATSIGDISFGLGIVARVGKGAKATMTRKAVADGVWMPTQVTLDGRGRAALIRTLVIDFVVDWFDYRRLPEDSVTPFLDARIERESGSRPQ
ncbi:MAG: hypothetical protein HOP16_22210 [Acidobacteria bacterium]|nr:hypothetical protein [Acidobacteriota bacterium]